MGIFFGTGYARNTDGSLVLSPSNFPVSKRAQTVNTSSPDFISARGADGKVDTGKSLANVLIGNPNPK